MLVQLWVVEMSELGLRAQQHWERLRGSEWLPVGRAQMRLERVRWL